MLVDLALQSFGLIPKVLVENAQLWNVCMYPSSFGVQSRNPFARVGVFDVAQSVPDKASDVNFVVKDACPAFTIAVDSACTPSTAHRSGNAFLVECYGNGAGRYAGGVVCEYAANDIGLYVVDGAFASRIIVGDRIDALDHIIAVGNAAARLALLDTAPQTAVCLRGQIFESCGLLEVFGPKPRRKDAGTIVAETKPQYAVLLWELCVVSAFRSTARMTLREISAQ